MRRAPIRQRASDVAANNPVPDAAVLGDARAARHSARRGVRRTSTSTSYIGCSGAAAARASSTSARCARSSSRRSTRLNAEARKPTAGSSREPCTATSPPRSPATRSSSTIPRRTRRMGRGARSRASLPAAWTGASGCVSPTTSARSTRGDVDVVALQIVTVGDAATRAVRELQARQRVRRGVLHSTDSAWKPPKRWPSGASPREGRSSASETWQTLLVGLRRLSRSRRSRGRIQAAACKRSSSGWC